MPFQIIRNDITKMKVDAIVNSANPSPIIGGGVDHAIHQAGGQELVDARIKLGNIRITEAKYTKGYNLPATYVIHAVGPKWNDGFHKEKILLLNTYMNSLHLAKNLGCASIAFPLISAGAFGFPPERAIKTATNAITRFLDDYDMMIYLVIYDDKTHLITKDMSDDIQNYINGERNDNEVLQETITKSNKHVFNAMYHSLQNAREQFVPKDETWQESLLRIIKERNFFNPDVYKRANITKQHFSKILKDKNYHPSKPTAIAFCFALGLNLEDSETFLSKAGYSLALGYTFDVIIHYFLSKEIYDIHEVNIALFEFKQDPLGSFEK